MESAPARRILARAWFPELSACVGRQSQQAGIELGWGA